MKDIINMEYAHSLLFLDPSTEKELFFKDFTDNGDESYSLIVTNKEGTSTWKHTIRTEEV